MNQGKLYRCEKIGRFEKMNIIGDRLAKQEKRDKQEKRE